MKPIDEWHPIGEDSFEKILLTKKSFIYLAKSWFALLSSNLFINVLISSFESHISVKQIISPVPFLYTSPDLIMILLKLKHNFFSNSSSFASFESKRNCSIISGLKQRIIFIFFKCIYLWQNNEFVTFTFHFTICWWN